MKTPFWKKTWFVMLMFFVFPPIGIALMWIGKKEWNKIIKIILSVIFGVYAFLWSIILFTPSDDSQLDDISATPTQEQTTLEYKTPTREESTTSSPSATSTEVTTAEPNTTKESSTTEKPTTTKKVTTTAKPTITKKVTTTAKPTTTKKNTTKAPASDSSMNYVLNTNTMKFHYPSCSSVDEIHNENRENFKGDRQTVIDRGFSPCGRCHP